jgi:hypothetical protein
MTCMAWHREAWSAQHGIVRRGRRKRGRPVRIPTSHPHLLSTPATQVSVFIEGKSESYRVWHVLLNHVRRLTQRSHCMLLLF